MIHRPARPPFTLFERPHLAWASCTLLLVFILAILSLPGPLARSDPLVSTLEQTGRPPLYAVVKAMANLRASPSMEGGILAIAREGTVIQVLGETERWYRVKTEEMAEVWIHKTLVLIQQVPLRSQPEPVRVPSPGPSAEAQPSPAAKQSTTPAFPPPEGEQLRPPASLQPAPSAAQNLPAQYPADRLQVDHIFAYFQSFGVYLIGALVVVLIASIGLQLRAAGQLQRAMREMDQVLDMVEEIRMGGALAPEGIGPTPTSPARPEADVARPLHLPAELSPLERAVLEAIHGYGEMQEHELVEKLKQRGFSGVLIKAVIGDIVRKTGSDGPPLVGVRHAQGQYSYQLRRSDVGGHTGDRERG